MTKSRSSIWAYLLAGLFILVPILGMSARQSAGENGRVPAAQVENSRNGAQPGQNLAAIKPLLPPPKQPPNLVALATMEQLGKDILFDHGLSDPIGYACATCHVPETGFTSPSSRVNQLAGPVPGVIPGRFGHRKPPSLSYISFSPPGPYVSLDADETRIIGGAFWDGRATHTIAQARMPFLDPNEMANAATGPLPPVAGGFSKLVARKMRDRPYTALFQKVFGANVFQISTDEQIYEMVTTAIAVYEASLEVNPFSSQYDAFIRGKAKLTASEENGRSLFFGKAQCSECHSSANLASVQVSTRNRDTFTMYCYVNTGVPRNPGNPVYAMTDCTSNPDGCNSQGNDFLDFGLGGNPNPGVDGTQFMIAAPGDVPRFRGLFKAPTLRNVDMRPSANFVKAYMHNGVFKSLDEVVHFYNKRNIAVNSRGKEVAFDLRTGPPPGFARLFPPPEIIDNVTNVIGVSPAQGTSDDESNGHVGNLGLTHHEERDLVNFLQTLTDGYTAPQKK